MEKLTKELVVASLIPDLAKLDWQTLFDTAKKIKVEKEAIGVNYADAMKLRELHGYLRNKQKQDDEPDKARIKARKEGYDSYCKPIEEILAALDPEFHRVNKEIIAEEGDIEAVIAKQNEIRIRHIDFVNDMVKQISAAPDNKDLGRIQSLVGSEKSRTGFYGDYFPNVEASCNDLLKMVDTRKVILKNNAKAQKDFEKAVAKGDMALAAELKELMEQNDRVVKENAQAIAESAYQKVAEISLKISELESASIRPRIKRWSYRVDDIELLYKKNPELVTLEPNAKAIGAVVKEKSKEISEGQELEINGLVIYQKHFYVAIKATDDAA
ncbi:MAG TPA: hypothetical protein VMR70_03995 [Flavisolibacter sp.]|nr:hypothetical protein [Flavisolibacter sp.]